MEIVRPIVIVRHLDESELYKVQEKRKNVSRREGLSDLSRATLVPSSEDVRLMNDMIVVTLEEVMSIEITRKFRTLRMHIIKFDRSISLTEMIIVNTHLCESFNHSLGARPRLFLLFYNVSVNIRAAFNIS